MISPYYLLKIYKENEIKKIKFCRFLHNILNQAFYKKGKMKNIVLNRSFKRLFNRKKHFLLTKRYSLHVFVE